jgi:hypothetical protein
MNSFNTEPLEELIHKLREYNQSETSKVDRDSVANEIEAAIKEGTPPGPPRVSVQLLMDQPAEIRYMSALASIVAVFFELPASAHVRVAQWLLSHVGEKK